MLDPPTHNRPFADKCDKEGMDGVPYNAVLDLSKQVEKKHIANI